METVRIASNMFALIYIKLAQFLNCSVKATHSLNLDHHKVVLKSNCFLLFASLKASASVYSLIVTENEIMHVKMFWKLLNENP